MILTWDGCSVQAKSRLLLMAVCKLAAQGFPRGFHFGGFLCHNMGCFLEHVFETICLPATCDRCCPKRVQDRQGSPANKHPQISDICSSSETSEASALSTWLCCTTSLPGRWERETGLIINLDVSQRRFSRWGLGGSTE